MTPFEEFKETAALVKHWIEIEKPKIKDFGCDGCKHNTYTFKSCCGYHTYSYSVCCCLPYWYKPIARISECPKKNNPDAGSLKSVCRVNK